MTQAKTFGWNIWRDVNPNVGQTLSVFCNHGHGPKARVFEAGEMGLAAAVMGPTTIHLRGNSMYYSEAPTVTEGAQRAHVWMGQCYDCGNRHIGFSKTPEWVMGLNIVRYAVQSGDINLMDWMMRSNSIWTRWLSEAPPAQLAQHLIGWAREDIERYG